MAVNAIAKKYDSEERSGEIIFYGASNFTRWETMEEDIPMYRVQNHGFGGSDDTALMHYANKILYPYSPKIVAFQTGSNDYVNESGTDEEIVNICIERKREMFKTFHEKMPDAHFVVLSGLLLPGRSEYLNLTMKINDALETLCNENDYISFVDCEELTYAGGQFDESRFVSDGIHLTSDARIVWPMIL